jgi:hypothetical protein
MATKLENLQLEIAHFNAFKRYLPNFVNLDTKTLEILLEMGMIEVSSAFERAIAEFSGSDVVSLDHADLSCGSDAKLVTVRTCNYGTTYSAPVSGIHNKTGDLLVQVYERKRNEFYWFRLPYETYYHIPKTSNIEIPFELNGRPRRRNKKLFNPWEFECKSFEEMCNINPLTPKAQKDSMFLKLFEIDTALKMQKGTHN